MLKQKGSINWVWTFLLQILEIFNTCEELTKIQHSKKHGCTLWVHKSQIFVWNFSKVQKSVLKKSIIFR